MDRLSWLVVVAVTLVVCGAAAAVLMHLLALPRAALLGIAVWWLVSVPIGVLVGFSSSLGDETKL